MTSTQSPGSPLTRLVLFICCLAIAASALAALHYLVIDLPQQKDVQAPENAAYSEFTCEVCRAKYCTLDPITCNDECELYCI